jgi:hypothetical protein
MRLLSFHSFFSSLNKLSDFLATLLSDILVVAFAVTLLGGVTAFATCFFYSHFSFGFFSCHRITP